MAIFLYAECSFLLRRYLAYPQLGFETRGDGNISPFLFTIENFIEITSFFMD